MSNKENTQYEIYAVYTETESGGKPLDPKNKESKREDLHKNITWIKAYRTNPEEGKVKKLKIDTDPSELEEVHIVIVEYESRNTFGNTRGNCHIIGVYGDVRKAVDIRQCLEHDFKYPEEEERYPMDNKPWVGDSAKFTEADVLSVKLYD